MVFRRIVVIAAAAASSLAAAAAFAGPAMTPGTLQCDGVTYLAGGNTHTPNPSIQVIVQDPTGIRIGTEPMGVTGTNETHELWNFNGVVTSSINCNDDGSAEYWFEYNDPNTSDTMYVGDCHYAHCTAGTGSPTIRQMLGATTCPTTLPNPTAAPTTYPNFFAGGKAGSAFGEAASFTGAAVQFASVTYNTTGLGDRPATYTLSAWINSTGSGATPQTILSEQEGGGGYWGFGLTGTEGVILYDSRNTSVAASMTSTFTIVGTGWHKVDVVRLNGQYERFYVDGENVGSVPANSTWSFANNSSSSTIFVGAYLAPGSKIFSGQIDQLRVVDAALTDDDIRMEYLGSNLHLYSAAPASSLGLATTPDFNPSISNDDTSAAYYYPGEAISQATAPNQRWIFEAQSTQSVSTILSTFTVTINTNPPTAPLSLSGAAASVNSITWSWSQPSFFCPPPGSNSVYYQLFDAAAGGAALNPPGNMAYTGTSQNVTETIAGTGTQNLLHSRKVAMTDTWGTGALSASASAYTEAAAPSAVTALSVSTGGLAVSWNANGNPGYTRYEVTYTADPNFVVGVTTAVGLGSNYTASSIDITSLPSGSTYYVRVRAFNGRASDNYGGAPTAYAYADFVTEPPAPALTGTPAGASAITWSWTQTAGATGYSLYNIDSSTPVLMPLGQDAAALSFTSTTLSVNTRYSAEVQADLPSPSLPSAFGQAFTYTLADPPSGPSVAAVYATSATFAWNANGNPSYTFYEVVVATDPTFDVVVQTVTVSAPTATISSLLPGVVYYSSVAAINGVQIPTAFVGMPPTSTGSNAAITVSSSPGTPYYAASGGLVGAWQFDEDTGTTTGDSSGNGDTGNVGCVTYACVSTPTWTAGPPGLGSALSFDGLAGGAVLTNSGTPFAFTGSMSVEAWVNPQTSAQLPGAGIVAVGPQNVESFALDVSASGAFRFLISNGSVELPVTVATATIAPGQWTYVVGVYNATNQTAALYLNGVPAAVSGGLPASRPSPGSVLAVGNRMNVSGSYAYPFFGKIDSVRVFDVALTAPQVQSDYVGSFVSSVTAPPPNAGIVVGLPPNAFGGPAQIFISANPVSDPIRVSPAALSAGIASPPAGLALVPDSLVEVVPVVGGQPFIGLLGSSATLTIPYNDPNGSGIISGSNPPLAVSGLQMYTLNTAVNSWTPLPTSINASNRSVTGVTPHFSVFGLFAPQTIGTSLSGVRVYPVPWKPGTGGRFDAPGVTFADLPAVGTISITTLSGQHVREISFSGVSAGDAVWDGNNDSGHRAASGVYFARIISSGDGSTTIVKFAIER